MAGLWGQLRARSEDMGGQLKSKAHTFKNANFSEASMAMCALIAGADGSIDPAERQKVSALIRTNTVLAMFPHDELQQRFDFWADRLTRDYALGKVEAVQTIQKAGKKPDQARAIVQIGIIIGGADGNFDDDEKQVVREACNALSIPPAEFDL